MMMDDFSEELAPPVFALPSSPSSSPPDMQDHLRESMVCSFLEESAEFMTQKETWLAAEQKYEEES